MDGHRTAELEELLTDCRRSIDPRAHVVGVIERIDAMLASIRAPAQKQRVTFDERVACRAKRDRRVADMPKNELRLFGVFEDRRVAKVDRRVARA